MKFLIPLLLFASLLTGRFAVADVVGDTPAAPMEHQLSAAAAELVQLADSNVEESVILAYVNNSTSSFNLSAADIVYLRDLGFSPEVITAVLDHDTLLREKGTNITQSAAPPQPVPRVEQSNQIYNAPPATAPSDLPPDAQRFYHDLAPFGTWVNSAEFGWGWQPTAGALNHDWRPYSDNGRWLWTDRGWYWASDYSWGDITFHYGRWLLTNDWGWLWFPDTVWAPAWVTWRVYDSYCGWAPLPPATFFDTDFRFHYRERVVWSGCDFDLSPRCFTFVHWRNCVDRNPRAHCIPTTHVSRFFDHTVIVNNFQKHNNVVINGGVDVKHVTAATGKQIAPVPIVTPASPVGKSRLPRIVRNGNPVAVVQKPLPVAPKNAGSTPLPTVMPRKFSQPVAVNVGAPSSAPRNHDLSNASKDHLSIPARGPSFASVPPPSQNMAGPSQKTGLQHAEEVAMKPNLNESKVVPVQKTPMPQAITKPANLHAPMAQSVPPRPESKPPEVHSHFSQPFSGNAIPSRNTALSAAGAPVTPPVAASAPSYVPPFVRQSQSLPPRFNQVEKIAQLSAPVAQVAPPSLHGTPPPSHAAPPAAIRNTPSSAVPTAAANDRERNGKGRK